MVMKEDILGVGDPENQDKSKSRYKRRSLKREDLKAMYASYNSVLLNTYLFIIASLIADE